MTRPLSEQEEQGQALARWIAVLVVLLHTGGTAFQLLTGTPVVNPIWIVQTVASLAFAWGIWKGYDWARFWIGLGLLFGAVGLFGRALQPPFMLARFVVYPLLAIPYATAAFVLFKSRSVEAYCYRNTKEKTAPQTLSLGASDDD
jgi:hypothetical protein